MGRATTVILLLLGAGTALAAPAAAEGACTFIAGDEQSGVQTCEGQAAHVRIWADRQTVGVATVTDDYPGVYTCETLINGECAAAYVVTYGRQQWVCASPLVSICLLRDGNAGESCYSLWFMGVPLPLERSCIDPSPPAWGDAGAIVGG